MIYITSDHGGINMKNAITKYFDEKQIPYLDTGPYKMIDEDDYTDYVIPVVEEMKKDPTGKGILVCRNGVGVSILANKFKGIRAGLSFSAKHAASSRYDDDTNVLALPADYISTGDAIQIVEKWLNSDFSQAKRHYRRIDKVNKYGQVI